MSQEIQGDKAEVKVEWKNGNTSDVELTKIDGKWKVSNWR